MPNYMKKVFSAKLRLPKTKHAGFEIWRVDLVTETNYRIFFYISDGNLKVDLFCRSYHLFSKKTADGKRRKKEGCTE